MPIPRRPNDGVTGAEPVGEASALTQMLGVENRMEELTHKVEITISGNYPHGAKQHASVSISGDGGLDHMIEAFKTALIAAGFAIDTAKKLDELDA